MPARRPPEDLRTTVTIPGKLVEQLDELVFLLRRADKVPRGTTPNVLLVRLAQERADQVLAELKSAPVAPKKRAR